MQTFDFTILTDRRYVAPSQIDEYIQNVLDEDRFVKEALEERGYRVHRCAWDDPDMDWSQTRYAIFRTTWDYFDRYEAFSNWLDETNSKTIFVNPAALLYWNIDKRYLRDLSLAGITIPPTIFIDEKTTSSLEELFAQSGWKEAILKPAVSGAARHTYRITAENVASHNEVFQALIKNEAMLLQEFQESILSRGEVSFMVFGGKYSHAILKKAKTGDFRVQDDFGGSIEDYEASSEEIIFAEKVVKSCKQLPLYARVDVMWDQEGNMCLSELELIEPELWFRRHPNAAKALAEALEQMDQS